MAHLTATKKGSWFRPFRQQGFTLIEAMIALAVFSIGILAVAAMGPVAINSNTAANDSSIVTNTSIGAIEEIFSMNWDADSFKTQPCTAPQAYRGLEMSFCITENTSQDEAETAMALTDETGRPAVRLIRVTITDPDSRGGNRELMLNLLKPKM